MLLFGKIQNYGLGPSIATVMSWWIVKRCPSPKGTFWRWRKPFPLTVLMLLALRVQIVAMDCKMPTFQPKVVAKQFCASPLCRPGQKMLSLVCPRCARVTSPFWMKSSATRSAFVLKMHIQPTLRCFSPMPCVAFGMTWRIFVLSTVSWPMAMCMQRWSNSSFWVKLSACHPLHHISVNISGETSWRKTVWWWNKHGQQVNLSMPSSPGNMHWSKDLWDSSGCNWRSLRLPKRSRKKFHPNRHMPSFSWPRATNRGRWRSWRPRWACVKKTGVPKKE